MATRWPAPLAALPLMEVASLLGITPLMLRELIAQKLIGVCTRKPLPVGYWGMSAPGRTEGISHRQPFNGKRLARLISDDAITCAASGAVEIRGAHEEPVNPDHYESCLATTYQLQGVIAQKTSISLDDLLISQVEFGRFTASPPCELSTLWAGGMSDASLGAATRHRMQAMAQKAREEGSLREAEWERWRASAADIQSKRSRPASKRRLAEIVKAVLVLPDAADTIRKHI